MLTNTLKNKNIIILGLMKFDGVCESTNFIMAKHLAQENKVFYVDYPLTWKDYYTQKNSDTVTRRKPFFSSSSEGIIDTEIPNLKVVITPPIPIINFIPEGKIYRLALKQAETVIIKRIKQIIKNNNIQHFIYINSFNFHYPNIADKINPALTVYHCVDPLVRPYECKHGLISEELLVKKSDLVVCTSKQLYKEKKTVNPNTYFIPNAADFAFLSQAMNHALLPHRKLQNIPRPIIGFLGNIERRMDYELLRDVMARHPNKHFVLAGPVEKEYVPEWFYTLRNLHMIGPIQYVNVPSFMKGLDVAIIPFKKDEVSRKIFPLKLFEYLASGKPVVATKFNPDLEEYTQDTVAFCDDAASFSQAITEALAEDGGQQTNRLAVALENTWEKRCLQFSDLIQKHLEQKEARQVFPFTNTLIGFLPH